MARVSWFEMAQERLLAMRSHDFLHRRLAGAVNAAKDAREAGKDWKDRELGRQSMILTAEKVIPRVNAATAKQSTAAE